jgi:hypothetical protein
LLRLHGGNSSGFPIQRKEGFSTPWKPWEHIPGQEEP